MREKDLHKIIRDNSADDNTILTNALKAKHPELAGGTDAQKPSEQQKPHNRSVKKLVAVFAPLSAAAVLAAVLIPTVLLGGNSTVPSVDDNSPSGSSVGDNSPSRPSITPPPDSAQSPDNMDYIESSLKYTVQEYNEVYGTSFLFFGDVTADYYILEYRHIATQAFLGLEVSINYSSTDEKITYTVCTEGADLEFLQYDISACKNESDVSNHTVKWGTAYGASYGAFSHDGYDYYIYVNSADQSRLFELIQDLLQNR